MARIAVIGAGSVEFRRTLIADLLADGKAFRFNGDVRNRGLIDNDRALVHQACAKDPCAGAEGSALRTAKCQPCPMWCL